MEFLTKAVCSLGVALTVGMAAAQAPAATTVIRGMTFVEKPIVLTPEDSGRTFVGEDGAVISGGVRLGPWREVARGVWETDAPKFFFDQLWVNGRRADCARLPARGFLTIARADQRLYGSVGGEKTGYLEEVVFTNAAVDALAELSPDELAAVQMDNITKWSYARRRLVGYDKVRRAVQTIFPEPWMAEGTNHLEWRPRYTLIAFENVRTAFREPGQWFLDVKNGKVRYRPLPGEKPETLAAYAPRHGLSHLVEFRGDPKNRRYVENVSFKNISFEHASFDIDAGERGPHQIAQWQAAYFSGGAIHANGAKNCTFENCRVAHTANYAFSFNDGCLSNRIVSCTLEDLGAGGVWIGERTPRSTDERPIVGRRFVWPTAGTSSAFNVVSNCMIRFAGLYNPEGCGVAIGDASDCRIVRNDIHDILYTGISVGWTQGYHGSCAQRNEIAFNRIRDLGKGYLSDMAGIYLLGTSFGTVVHDNVVHDVKSYSYGGSGLYCDEGTEGVILENNLVWNTTDSNFYEHFGEGNIVRNNIFAWNGEFAAIRFYRVHKHGVPSSLDFVNNIVLTRDCRMTGDNAAEIYGVWANNVWWATGGAEKVAFDRDRLKWPAWCAVRHETGSVLADPGFVDAERFDFRLRPDSPAIARGFRPFDYTRAGGTGWVNGAVRATQP